MPGNTLAMSHPVGVDYRMAQLKSGAKLRDPLFLDPAVKLENGLVGCTSCHDANSELPAKLVMLNTGSRLCFACHDL
jgi:predicted CXXCH cytochrome family protein